MTEVEYHGVPGISKDCRDAILRLIQFGDEITHARILSAANKHCFLLSVNTGDLVAIRSGFTSGYPGEGPRTLSEVLVLMHALDIKVDEYEVKPKIIEKVDTASLSHSDLETILSLPPIRPERWIDYVMENHWADRKFKGQWHNFPCVIPYAIIDPRIMDLATSFWDGPDDSLMTGYRRFETVIQKRTLIEENGYKLFNQAFAQKDGKLSWSGIKGGEHSGRLSVITGTYNAYRNRRAHKELGQDNKPELLREFLLLNHLFELERTAIDESCENATPGKT